MLDEEAVTIAIASQAGFRCFTEIRQFRAYINDTILAGASDVE